MDVISHHENQQVALAETMYKLITEFLNELISFDWMGPNSKIALIGGVIINCDQPGG